MTFDYDYQFESGYTMTPNSIYDKLTIEEQIMYTALFRMARLKGGIHHRAKINLSAGQMIVSVSFLVNYFEQRNYSKLTKKVVENRIKALVNLGLIKVLTAGQYRDINGEAGRSFQGKHGTLITINKFNEIRNPDNYGGKERGSTEGKNGAQGGQNGGRRGRKKGNNLNEEINKPTKEESTCTSSCDDSKRKNLDEFVEQIRSCWNENADKFNRNITMTEDRMSKINIVSATNRANISYYRKVLPEFWQWEKAIEALFKDEFWNGKSGEWKGKTKFTSFLRKTKDQPINFFNAATTERPIKEESWV